MNRNSLYRAVTVALVLAAAITATQALILRPVYATAIGFTSSSTQSSVQLVISNPNPVTVDGNLTLVLETSSGVTRTWPVGRVIIPQGNSYRRVLIPSAITGVRWARVTNLSV